jgi:hypothetical protein
MVQQGMQQERRVEFVIVVYNDRSVKMATNISREEPLERSSLQKIIELAFQESGATWTPIESVQVTISTFS